MKAFDMASIKPFFPAADESKLANVGLRLPASRRATARQARRTTAMLRKTRAAVETIERLPESGESLHCVLNGSFALADFIGATLQLAGAPLDELIISTLGFSRKNCEMLSQLIDAGQIKTLAVLCSHYFAASDSEIFAQMTELCQRHGFQVCAMRNHAKLLLMQTGAHSLVVESSANLRSCFNTETATMFSDPELYAFHRTWIDELLAKGAEK